MRTLALLSCLAVACDAGEKPTATPVPPTAQQPKNIGSRSEITFEGLPVIEDGELVARIDLTELRGTALWRSSARDLCAQLLGPELPESVALDHLSIIIASASLRSSHALVAARGGQDYSRLIQLPVSLQTLRSFVSEKTGMHLERVTGDVRIGKRFDAHLAFTLGSLVEATNAATLVQSQRQSPQIKQLFDHFDCVAQGAELRLAIGMTEAQLAAVLPELRTLLGAN